MKKWVSLSYPRSGATWVRYCARTMLGIPLNMGGHDDYKTPVEYIKMHYPPTQFPKHKIRGLVLCIRDYKECFVRQYIKALDKLDLVENFSTGDMALYKNIKYFDQFSGEKILFYYEDFIDNPRAMIIPLANFLDVDPKPFLDNLDEHIAKSIISYETHIDPSMTKGLKAKHHQLKLTPKQREEMDRIAEDEDPHLFSQYLEHYKEQHLDWF